MLLTGFTDEAAPDLAGQIRAARALGWTAIEARNIDGVNLHELDDQAFARARDQLQEAGIGVACLGSAIANGKAPIDEPASRSLEQARRAIARMRALGCTRIRIMSWNLRPGLPPAQQDPEERIRRLRVLVALFRDAGIAPLHENCFNYGGMGWTYTRQLLDAVPGLGLVFDTGNPVHSDDWSAPLEPDGRRPKQSAWEFWRQVRDHVAHIHIKDGWRDEATGRSGYGWPGEGRGDVRRILADCHARGYAGAISIEPHLAVDPAGHPPGAAPEEIRFADFLEYGRRTARLIAEARAVGAAGA